MRIAISLHHTSFWRKTLLGDVSDNPCYIHWIVCTFLNFKRNDSCLSILFFYNQENIYNEEDEKRLKEKVKEIKYEEIKFKEEENRERKIFFDANYKTIYKAVMYDIRLKEHEEYDKKYIEEAFINALEYMYRVSYYKEYLIINNSRLTNQYKKSEIRLEKDKKLKTADLSKEIKDIKNV